MSEQRTDQVSAEFEIAANRVRALARLLPGDGFEDDRSYLLAVSAYLQDLVVRAPHGDGGGRLRLVGEGTRSWITGSSPSMPRNSGQWSGR